MGFLFLYIMENLIDWSFAPQPKTKMGNGYHASIYYSPNKKSPNYTMQLHVGAPTKLLQAKKVSFGLFNASIVITNTEKDVGYNVNHKKDTKDAQINGKGLCLEIIKYFDLDPNKNHKLRLNFNPIGSDNLRLWEIELVNKD